MRSLRSAVSAALLCLLGHDSPAADTAYLRRGDVVVCVGDSVTAAGVYDGFLQAMLDRLYPGAGIRVVNRGQGGQTAAAAKNLLRSAIDAEHPTLATFMFGVNDTRWSAGDEEAKAKAFTSGLAEAVQCAEGHGVTPILLRESHFSHGRAADEFATKVNAVLDRLLAAQEAFAAERFPERRDGCPRLPHRAGGPAPRRKEPRRRLHLEGRDGRRRPVEEGGRIVPRAICLPKLPAEALSLRPAGADAWSLTVRVEPEGPTLGVSMRVTDNATFKHASTPLFWLTGHRGTGQEPMGFVQLGGRDAGVLYRVGY